MKERERRRQGGFTILELLIATVVFLTICAAIFGLLELSQKNYGNESQMSGTFQEARLVVDQIVRDFNQAGFPSQEMFSVLPNAANYAVGPVAWSPGYPIGAPAVPCTIGSGGTCATPGDFDLIIETQPNNATSVQWIRYQLVNGTLYRSVVAKVAGTDPVTATSAATAMVPFLTNVLNNPTAAQLTEINATYPAMFPGGATTVPIFQYSCDSGAGTVLCSSSLSANSSNNIRDVEITLIVATPVRDAQTQRLRIVELTGRAHRLNPSN